METEQKNTAFKVWTILCRVISNKDIIMPQQIAEEIGSGEKDLEPVFDTLKTYCEKHELPIIPYVVIDHELKETIKNFPSRYKEYFNQQLFWVYDYEWGSMENPFKPLA